MPIIYIWFFYFCIFMQRAVAYLLSYVAGDCSIPFSCCTMQKKLVELFWEFLCAHKRKEGELTMDEVMGVEARELPVRGLAGVLAVLLGIVLIADQTFRAKLDGFLNSRLVPVAQEDVFGKIGLKTLYRENESIEHEVDLLIESTVIPKDSGLLLKDALPVSAPIVSEQVLSKHPAVEENVAALQSAVSETVPPQVEETGHLLAEFELPEIMMPAPEEPSVIVPEYLPDTTTIVEEIVSDRFKPIEIVPEGLPDILAPEDTVAEDSEKPSAIVSEQQPETPASTEVTTPAPVETDAIVLEKPAEEPAISEPIVTDTEISDSEMIEDVPADTAEEEEGELVPVSCFLLDEAGMLIGFLPEYAESDGYLELPPECTGIRSGAFSGCGAGIFELYIPAGAAVIEEGAFYGLDNLEWIEVESGNPAYASEFGVLFDSSMSVLIKFPCGRVGTYSVPTNVTMIANGAFDDTLLEKVDIRNCMGLSLSENVLGYLTGNGIEILMPQTRY